MVTRSSRDPGKNNVPRWLLLLALTAVLAAFSRVDGDAGSAFQFDGIAFDLGSVDSAAVDAAHGGYSPARRSNRAFAMLRADGGRFIALYGPPGAATPTVAGVLIGDGNAEPGRFMTDNLHDFSLETGVLRVNAQEGRFAPARFIAGDTVDAVSKRAAPAGRYDGRLSEQTGAGPATLAIDAAGALVIASDRCHARGHIDRRADAAPWPLQLGFDAGCARPGERLHGHAWQHGDTLVVVLATATLDGGAVFIGTPAAPR